jgi:hypothetical protein
LILNQFTFLYKISQHIWKDSILLGSASLLW